VPLDGQNVLPALRGEGHQLPPKRFWQWSRGVPVITHNAALRDGDWKLVRPGDELANSFPGWERDLRLYADVDFNPWKYVESGVPEATGRPPCLGVPAEAPLLFNMATDPFETTDLADRHPERVARMLCELENWFDEVERDRRTITDKPYRSAESFFSEPST